TDTVGFVSDLPHKLISAFSATLEETAQADVLLHVVDAAAPNSGQQIEDVENVLREIHAGDIPCIKVYNKTDLLPSEEQNTGIWRDAAGKIAAVRISVAENTGIDALREAIAESCAAAPNTDETEMP
ncbi:TPA: GTPase HflX, partial [Neisseria meningitidis]